MASLKTAAHRGGDPFLRLGGVHLFTEEIGIALEVRGGCECDRVDAVLNGLSAGVGKLGYAAGECPDEIVQVGSRYGSIYPAIPFGEVCVVVIGTE